MSWEPFFRAELRRVKEKQEQWDQLALRAREAAVQVGQYLAKKHEVEKVILFGSLINDQFRDDSDIDIGVSGLHPTIYFQAYREAEEIAAPFRLDLIDLDHSAIASMIQEEGVTLYERTTDETR
jgi:predicted nucleotidyltransferase